MMTTEEYVRLQNMWLNASGVKKGDWVKVTRAAEDHESGWDNSWIPSLNAVVGTFVRILGSWGAEGIEVATSNFSFPSCKLPFFVLKPAEAPKPEKYRLQPFEQVLTRDEDTDNWVPDLFRFMNDNNRGYPFNCLSNMWRRCVPYAGHEHLLGATDEPEDWAKYYDKE